LRGYLKTVDRKGMAFVLVLFLLGFVVFEYRVTQLSLRVAHLEQDEEKILEIMHMMVVRLGEVNK
jgi:hypothetical protein